MEELEEAEEEEEDEAEEEEEVLPRPVRTQAPPPRDMPNRPKNESAPATPRSTNNIKKEAARTASAPRSSVPHSTERKGNKATFPKSNVRVEIPSRRPEKSNTPTNILPSPMLSSPQAVEAKGYVFSEEDSEKLIELHDDILTVSDDRTIDFWIQWHKEVCLDSELVSLTLLIDRVESRTYRSRMAQSFQGIRQTTDEIKDQERQI